MRDGTGLAGDYDNRTCLHLAASVGSVSVVDLLLKVPGIELNPVDRFGGTPLDDAYRHGNRLCITVLQLVGAKRGTDPEVRLVSATNIQGTSRRAVYIHLQPTHYAHPPISEWSDWLRLAPVCSVAQQCPLHALL